jgi:hypothetical protein
MGLKEKKKKMWILLNGLKLKQDGLKLITKVDLDQNKWIWAWIKRNEFELR